ncbi:hypothetical protein BDM02DRAFT_3257324 [Thelephora ganbajun]|uniref:Uncharacterized protein n=1 Tax=Thelephora ganbajun TaxID=370292 RepID=A0ACB6ZY48_THEGA|nr:hypothetical protein BDM02DRAFT_3257324 [Thelephora ganbajun]
MDQQTGDYKATRLVGARCLSLSPSLSQTQTSFRTPTQAPPPGKLGKAVNMVLRLRQSRSEPQPIIGYTASFFWTKWTLSGHPNIYSSAELHLPNTETKWRAASPPDTPAIKTVTPITCHQSQITVTLRQVQIRKIQQDIQDSRQERAQEQRPVSGAKPKAVCKKEDPGLLTCLFFVNTSPQKPF